MFWQGQNAAASCFAFEEKINSGKLLLAKEKVVADGTSGKEIQSKRRQAKEGSQT
jgi:hypothetical protein